MSLTNWLVVVLADGRFYPRAVNLVVNSNELPVSCHGSLIHSIGGSRVYICSGGEPARNAEKTVWTRAARQRAFGAQMGGLCTGALALAKAGVLSHLEITPHWEKMDGPRETFSMPNPSEKAYVVDGRASASAGGTTSAELFLTRLQNDFGPKFATIAREMMKIADARSPDARQTNSRAATLYGRNKRLINII